MPKCLIPLEWRVRGCSEGCIRLIWASQHDFTSRDLYYQRPTFKFFRIKTIQPIITVHWEVYFIKEQSIVVVYTFKLIKGECGLIIVKEHLNYVWNLVIRYSKKLYSKLERDLMVELSVLDKDLIKDQYWNYWYLIPDMLISVSLTLLF